MRCVCLRLCVESKLNAIYLSVHRVLSVSPDKDTVDGMSVPSTDKAWQHLQSLYQSNLSQCLFGKNNILVKPVSKIEYIHEHVLVTNI